MPILTVSVNGANSVTINGLAVNKEYCVELTAWSWRYAAQAGNVQTVSMTTLGQTVYNVLFTMSSYIANWLDDFVSVIVGGN